MDLIDLIEAKGIKYEQKSKDQISIICPNESAHQGGRDAIPSFNINTEKLISHCFSCGFSLSGDKLIGFFTGESVEELDLKAMSVRAKIKQLQGPDKSESHSDIGVMVPPGTPWDEDGFRGISLKTYQELGAIRCTRGHYADRLVFPVYVNDELIGIDARALKEQTPKYLRNKGCTCKVDWMFPFDKVKDMKPKFVIIAEGIFHAVRAYDLGFPALCFFGSNNFSSTKLRMLMSLGVEEVVYFKDNDKAGIKAEQEICYMILEWLPVTSAYTSHLEEGRDLGDCTREEIEVALERRTKPLIPECLPTGKPEFLKKCKIKCPFNESGVCQNMVW